ncbi:MAG: hypothetical protein ACLP1X_25385 [Polyangiaceae bacterium]
MPAPPISQHALTVIANVRAGAEDALEKLLDTSSATVATRLALVTTLHYGRFVVFDDAKGNHLLAFESNYDGEESRHLAELRKCLAADLDAFLGHCEGYAPAAFDSFVAAHAVKPRPYYIAHGGLSVLQVRHDADVRATLEAWLDAADAAGTLRTMSARAIALALKADLKERKLDVGPIDRGLPKGPWAKLALYAMMPAIAAVGLVFAAIARIVYEPEDDREDAKSPPQLVSDQDPAENALEEAEDLQPQNGLTHVVPLKAGSFRLAAVRFVLWFVEQAAEKVCYEGTLGGIATIHFARWSLLTDDTLVFFSNYDGSWESYLGDFIDKAHIFLTAIWTNTKWFPKTSFLVVGGASNEAPFKQWTRTFQRRNQIWYSAYGNLTVTNVLNNAKIRELAGGPMKDDAEALRWLALL